MKELRPFRRQWFNDERPPVPSMNPDRNRIEVEWGDTTARAVELRQAFLSVSAGARLIRLHPDSRSEHDTTIAWVAGTQTKNCRRQARIREESGSIQAAAFRGHR